jgi:hypothetical protein
MVSVNLIFSNIVGVGFITSRDFYTLLGCKLRILNRSGLQEKMNIQDKKSEIMTVPSIHSMFNSTLLHLGEDVR